jgi:hypothetical protein
VQGSAIIIDPSAADRFARAGLQEATVTASSAYTPDPQDQPRSVFDDNPATSWVSSPGDPRPALTIRWGSQRMVSQVTIQRPPGAAAPMQVLITGSAGQAKGATVSGASAVITFKAMQTTSLSFTFTPEQSPVQISGIVIPGVPFLTVPTAPFRLACGLGPMISVNGKIVPTKVSGTFSALLTGQPVQFSACGAVTLAAGTNRVVEPAADAFDVQDVVLTGDLPTVQAAGPAPAAILSWTSVKRTLRVAAPTPSYLVVNENFNAGWQAVINGRRLSPVRLDGWKQAWLLPAGTTGVATLTYQPESLYRLAVVGGLVALALVLLVAAWPFRRRPKTRRLLSSDPLSSDPLSCDPLSSLRASLAPVGPSSPTPDGPASLAPVVAPLQRHPSRLRRLGERSLPALLTCLLAVAGFWLGGYPGAVILPAATLLFLVSTGYRGSPNPSGLRRFALELLRPRALAGLLLVVSVASAAGEHLVLAGDSGWVATALVNAIPQVMCLVIVARLAAALIIP